MKADGCGWGVSDVRVIRSCIKVGAFSSILLSFQAFRHHHLHFACMGETTCSRNPHILKSIKLKTFHKFGNFWGAGEGEGRFA